MKVRVDQSLCTGHARCNAIDPDLFLLDDVGYSSIDTVEVPPGLEDHARQAEANCPEHAISIELD
jgi:ferredoxin